jgi:hypothetical protein
MQNAETVKAIFIDAQNKEVKEINLPKHDNTLQVVYPMLGEDCELVEGIVYVNASDLILGDESAYYHNYDFGFVLDQYGYIHGNAVILGADNNGDNADVDQYLLGNIKSKITFPNKNVVEYMVKKQQNTPFTFSSWDI